MPRCLDVLLLALVGCGAEPTSSDATASPTQATPAQATPAQATPVTLMVVTLSHPVDWLVRRMSPPGAVSQRLLLDPGADPPSWRPTGEQVAALATADLIVANGGGYEAWTAAASLPATAFVDSARAVALVDGPESTHSHGDEGAHTHSGPDPHTWMDPVRFAQQAEAVRAALVQRAPGLQRSVDPLAQSVAADLDALAEAMRAATTCLRDATLAANHPSFTYVADRYDLDIAVIDLDPEAEPTAEQRHEVAHWAEGKAGPIVLWESPPDESVTAALAGVRHVALDPLEQPQDGEPYDYLAQANANLATLAALCPTVAAPDAAP